MRHIALCCGIKRNRRDYEIMFRKKILVALLVFCCLFGCGCVPLETSESTIEVSDTVPEGAIVPEDSRELTLSNISITLPEGYKYGKEETEYVTMYYVWRSEAEYVFPSSRDVMFYVYEGIDDATPAASLDERQAKLSIDSYIMGTFSFKADKPRINKDPNLTSNVNWYTLVFTGSGGSEYQTTTYGEYCYPKSYYGIYTLCKPYIEETHSRVYYGFVFSNDAQGELFEKEDYESLLEQIKSGFDIKEFYSPKPLNYDATKDVSNGYSYEQLESLFLPTANYYIILNEKNKNNSNTSNP